MISTGIAIPQIYWDKSTCSILPTLPIELGIAEILQRILDQQYFKAERIIKYAEKKSLVVSDAILKTKFSFA